MKKLLSKTQIFIVLLATASQPVYGLLENGFNTTRPSWFFDGVIPAEITPQLPKACVESYTASIACNKTILMSPNVLEKPDTLETVCESSCAESMLKFEKNVKRDCSDVDLVGLGLEDSWMSLILMGKAGILLYWKQCVRDKVTNELCTITQADYELAWNAATADTANTDAVAAFCADNCLTQTIVLNAPTQENLNDLQLMCKNEKILDYPFIEHMIFAKLVRRPDAAAQGDTLGPGLEGLVAPGSGRMGGHSGSSASSSLLSYGLSWIIAPLATIHLIYWL